MDDQTTPASDPHAPPHDHRLYRAAALCAPATIASTLAWGVGAFALSCLVFSLIDLALLRRVALVSARRARRSHRFPRSA